MAQAVNQLGQWPQRGHFQAGGLVARLNALLPGVAITHRVAQQQALQAKLPAVLLQTVGQGQPGALPGVQPPANARLFGPLAQTRQRLCRQVKAPRQRGRVEQVEHLADGKPGVRAGQQRVQRAQQRRAVAHAAVGQGKRQMARVAGRNTAKHRAHMRRIRRHIGHHHHHVTRGQRRAGRLGSFAVGQQLIVENFHFALAAVRQMKAHRQILCRHRQALSRGGGRRGEVEHAMLQLAQQGVGAGRDEQVDPLGHAGQRGLLVFRLVVAIQQPQKIPPMPAPGRQQRLIVGVQAVQRRQARLWPAPRQLPRHRLAVCQVTPIMLAGVMRHQHHLAMPAQRRQRFNHLLRQRRNAKHYQPAWQAGGPGGQAHQGIDKLAVNAGAARRVAALCGNIRQQRPPQGWLPVLVGGNRPAGRGIGYLAQLVCAGLPVQQPVGTVYLVLVKQLGQLARQLVALAPVAIVAQKMLQWGKHRLILQGGQQAQDAPDQRLPVQRRALRHGSLTQHPAVGAPEKLRWQLHAHRRANPGFSGQRQLQPLAHALALHQKHVVFQRGQRLARQPAQQQIAQVFQPVALPHHQAAAQFCFVRHCAPCLLDTMPG